METHTDRSLIAHHAIRALILSGFAFYVIKLVRTDSLTLYIAPRTELYVKLAAMGLYAVAAVQLYQAFRFWHGLREKSVCGCENPPSGSTAKNAAIYGLFLVPLLVLFTTPDTTIGSAMAGQKGIYLSAEFSSDPYSEPYAAYARKIYQQPLIEVTDKSYLEILTTLDMYLDRFIGKKLTINGFVYRDDTIAPGSFVLGRFAVQCCTADAMPYGVMVSNGKANANPYPNDTWLRITGTLEKTVHNGIEIMGLRLEKAEKIKPADDPYVYPDLDFGLEEEPARGSG